MMLYLVKKHVGPKPRLQVKDRRVILFVADTHTFDLKGKQMIALTDIEDYAQEFNLEEATEFVKAHKEFIIEDPSERREKEEISLWVL